MKRLTTWLAVVMIASSLATANPTSAAPTKIIGVPGKLGNVEVDGINDSGQIVGAFYDARGVAHGFVQTSANFAVIDGPGGFGTFANGINAAGVVVGQFYD